MTLPWLIAGIATLTAGILAGLWLRIRVECRTLQQEHKAEHEKLQTQLARAHQLRTGILTAVDDAILVLDAQQKILYANPTAESLVGQNLTGETLIGALRHPELETLIDDAKILQGDNVERRVEMERRILRAHAIAVEQDNITIEVLTLRDVTELQQLERARRDMVSNITHELSHPITNIALLSDTLINVAEKEKPKRIRKMAKDIRIEADQLTQLVAEMRDLSLIESGQMPIRLMPIELRPVIDAAVNQLAPLAENKEQTVAVAVNGDHRVLADDNQLQRAIKNILHNAIKFSPPNREVRISATPKDNEIIIAVQDRGPGIPSEDLPRIFERFYQVDRARRDGTGLGLAIVRHIVRAHGGRTWAESTEGEGATFYIAIALGDAEPDQVH